MNNFADDEFKQNEEPSEHGTTVETPATPSVEEEVNEDSFFRKKAVRIPLRIIGGLFIIGTAVSLYWARIPETFDINEMARERAVAKGHRELDQPLPKGYRTVATTIFLAEQLLEKPGGYQSNDITPMTRIPDNMRNWEQGVVTQLQQVMMQGLLLELSRPGPQSGELPELRNAFTRFSYDSKQWMFQSTESQYRDGIKSLEAYLDLINSSPTEGKYFITRQDQVIKFLDRQKLMLGTYSTNLQMNIGETTFDTSVLTEDIPEGMEEISSNELQKISDKDSNVSSFRERDDLFYQARGGLYVMYHTMLALRKDCEKLLNDSQSMGVMNRLINNLESACKPMASPIVLNGEEFGAVQNHSLVLAGHVAKAHLAIQELQKQISGGGGG